MAPRKRPSPALRGRWRRTCVDMAPVRLDPLRGLWSGKNELRHARNAKDAFNARVANDKESASGILVRKRQTTASAP